MSTTDLPSTGRPAGAPPASPPPSVPPIGPASEVVHPPVPDVAGSRPLGVPLYQSHTFGFTDATGMAEAFRDPDGPYLYGRYRNPTVAALETAVANLERGAGTIAAASGMGAISTTLWALLRSGDRVVAQDCLYGGTRAVLNEMRDRWGVTVEYVPADDPDRVADALRPGARILLLETIANPTVTVTDIPRLAALARAAGALTVVDNTFATPLLCRPIEHGADIVLHSATKYLGGHSDVLGGLTVVADPERLRATRLQTQESGATLDPFAAWLIARGMKTLAVRLARQCTTTQTLAERLAAHPAVAAVHYPGLPDHPTHATARRLLDGGYGGVLAFELAGGRPAGEAFVSALRLVSLAPSLGDVRTLTMHPASTSHRQLEAEELATAGIGPGLIRVSAGIEDVEDLWADVERALAVATGT